MSEAQHRNSRGREYCEVHNASQTQSWKLSVCHKFNNAARVSDRRVRIMTLSN